MGIQPAAKVTDSISQGQSNILVGHKHGRNGSRPSTASSLLDYVDKNGKSCITKMIGRYITWNSQTR